MTAGSVGASAAPRIPAAVQEKSKSQCAANAMTPAVPNVPSTPRVTIGPAEARKRRQPTCIPPSKRIRIRQITPIRSTSRIETCSASPGKTSDASAATRRKIAGPGTGNRSVSFVAASASRNPEETIRTIAPKLSTSFTERPPLYRCCREGLLVAGMSYPSGRSSRCRPDFPAHLRRTVHDRRAGRILGDEGDTLGAWRGRRSSSSRQRSARRWRRSWPSSKAPKRAAAIEAIKTARSFGDLSENFEYHAAKNDQGLLEARIRKLRHRLHHAVTVEHDTDEHVGVGSIVRIEDENGDAMEVEISSVGGVSPDSPLGGALMGATVGDVVDVPAPRGVVEGDGRRHPARLAGR